jgi:hypothetical protein|tara:strand:+ start:239 stop:466 length:228 start_codon:yes stop_codon:yes gene_type:complete
MADKKNPAEAGLGFSRDSTNWGRGLAPRGGANSRHTAALRDTSGANPDCSPENVSALPPDASAKIAPLPPASIPA